MSDVSGREKMIDNGLPHRARRAGCGLQVHKQPRTRIHFHNRTALLIERSGNVLGDKIDAGDVQADNTCRQLDCRRHAGVYRIGHVDGYIRSEERRVGNEGLRSVRSWWAPYHYTKKNYKIK